MLLSPPVAAKARSTPTEHSVKPDATRGMNKADRELDFVFIAIYLKVLRAKPERSRFSLREEGEVAWLESPNGLDATAEFQLRGRPSSLNFLRFSAIRPHP